MTYFAWCLRNVLRVWLVTFGLFAWVMFIPAYAQNSTQSHTLNQAPALSLSDAIATALNNDPWLSGSQFQQQALEQRSQSAGILPDPVFSLGLLNLPSDSFALGQENMTQIKVGVSQALPRGDTLQLTQTKLSTAAQMHPLQRADRRAQLTQRVTQHWLDAYLAQATLAIYAREWNVFEQLIDITQSQYRSALGSARQANILAAELTILQIEDTITAVEAQRDVAFAALSTWLFNIEQPALGQNAAHNQNTTIQAVADTLPLLTEVDTLLAGTNTQTTLVSLLQNHPALQALGVKQDVAQHDVAIAKQAHAPQWGFNAAYALRDDQPDGRSRADLFSLGVTVQMPINPDAKQDRDVAASIANAEAVKTEQRLLLQTMYSEVQQLISRQQRLVQRQDLYQNKLLPQAQNQTEVLLAALTNDDTDYQAVLSAKMTQIQTHIAALKIDVELAKIKSQLMYYLQPQSTVYSAHHAYTQRIQGE
jgi:outer membrane protein TolC